MESVNEMSEKSFNVTEWLKQLAVFSSTDPFKEGVTRLPFTPEQEQAADFIASTMKELGMEVSQDTCGTVYGVLPGKSDKTVVMGSHYDSVRCGGIYDGDAGIAVGLGVVQKFREKGEVPEVSLAVLATNDEEGISFQEGFLSSKTFVGEHAPSDYERLIHQASGKSAAQLMQESRNQESRLHGESHPETKGALITCENLPGTQDAYLEVHVEQGPVLDSENIPFGVVQGIVSHYHCTVVFQGESNHAGTTPMNLRKDPMPALGTFLANVPAITEAIPHAVVTNGQIAVSPGASNVIADKVTVSVDLRAPKMPAVETMKERLGELLVRIKKQFPQIYICQENEKTVSGCDMDPDLQDRLRQSLKQLGETYLDMNSGAGHDAQIIAPHIPSVMLFVPSKGGYSHSAKEFTDETFLSRAVDVAYQFCQSFHA